MMEHGEEWDLEIQNDYPHRCALDNIQPFNKNDAFNRGRMWQQNVVEHAISFFS